VKALVVVDVQNDFLPGGALAVPDGGAVVPVANRVMRHFDLLLATQDWHPADHRSFASQHPGRVPGDRVELAGIDQVLWPDHCVAGSHGAEFAPGLDASRFARVFRKGTDRELDSYSGFFDGGQRKATGLGDYLKERSVDELWLLGLATDYCVLATALDARRLGHATHVVLDGCRGVDVAP
jgi:nicotinamidase/pyrazinamidase